jgi:hypothetical protein
MGQQQLNAEAAVADSCFAAGGGHGDQRTIGGQFQHGVWVGRTELAELVRCKPQAGGESLRQVKGAGQGKHGPGRGIGATLSRH